MTNQKHRIKRNIFILLVIIPAILFNAFYAIPVRSIALGDEAPPLPPTATPTGAGQANPGTQKELLSFPTPQENLTADQAPIDGTGQSSSDVPPASEIRQDAIAINGQPFIADDAGPKLAPASPREDSQKLVPSTSDPSSSPEEKILPSGSSIPGSPTAADGWSTIMSETFEGNFPSGAWTTYDNDGATNGEFFWDDTSYMAYNGSWSAWAARGGANGLDPANNYYPNYARSWMVYGPFDMSNATDAELLFYYWNQSELNYDYFGWYASTNGTNFYGTSVSGDSGGWNYVNFDLTAVPNLGNVTGDSSVWIAFVFTSDSTNVGDGPFVDNIFLQKYAPTTQANLVPYIPGGWDYPVVPSSVTGTTTVGTLYSTQNTYIDWAVINNGASTATTFVNCLYLDDTQLQCWTSAGLGQYYYNYVTDWLLTPSATGGWHTFNIVADVYNNIAETDEGDNFWSRSYYWNGPTQPNLIPFAQSGWDYPIVPSTWTGTHYVSTLYAAQDTYADWAVLNSGASTSTTFTSCLYYDNVQIQCWDTGGGLSENQYAYVEDWLIYPVPTAGAHTLKIIGDVNNNIAESNEGDNAWEHSFTWLDSCPASSHSPGLVAREPSPLVNDVLPLPDHVLQRKLFASDSLSSDPRSNLPGRYDNAVFMTGDIAVGIVLPESSGNGENWTDSEKNCVVQKIQAGMSWWQTKGGSAANLNFIYDTHLGVPTSYEPIDQTTSDQGLWIGDVMSNMGYSGADYWEKVYSYTEYLKQQYNTEWAYVFLVADSSNDPDGTFAGGPYFAYTYLGGPFVIMTYDNDGWGIGDMNWVATHETGHVFRAGDQYYQAGYGGCTSTTERYGYLGIANSNCEYNNPNSVPSIMRSNEDALDDSAKGQIGWQDSNGNGMLDPIDTLPEFNLLQYSPDPTTQNTLSYTGYIYDKPWPYAVCGDDDRCFYKDITLHTITSAQYRLDGGSWSNVTFVDGAADSDFEQISFTTASLADGLHTVDVIAYNSIGKSTTWSDQVTVRTPKILTIAKAGTGSGTVTSSPAGISCGTTCSYAFAYNTVVTLTASATSPSTFAGWSGEGCSGTGTCTVTMSTARNVTATFNSPGSQTLTVTRAGTGSGTVTSSPAGINCGADCTEAYAYNTTVTLTASAATGSTFAGWSGACSGTGICTVTMTAARSVTATFNLNTYNLTVSKAGTGSGTVTSDPAGISCGVDCSEVFAYNTMVTLSAAPVSGSTFTGWSGGGCSGTGSCTVTMTATTTVTATFTVQTPTLTVTRAGTGSGTVTSNPAGISCGADCSEAYTYNTVVTLTAAPAIGSTFTGWSGGSCSGTGSCTVTMTAATSVTATFTAQTPTLTVVKAGTGSGMVTSNPAGIDCGADCSEAYTYNTVVTLTASAATGSTFAGWSGACSGIGSCTVTMTTARSVTATFNALTPVLTVVKAGTGSGTLTSNPAGINCGVDCSETYAYNTVVTLTASAMTGSTFAGWSGGGCSGTDTCSVTMTAATTVTATFNIQVIPQGAAITIGTQSIGTFPVLASPSTIISQPNTVDGPVRVTSTTSGNLFASERVISGSSFNEIMGYPANQLTTEYWFPWYDNLSMSTWVLVSNPSTTSSANVDIYIGGVKRGSYSIDKGKSITPRFALQTGPVRVVSTNGVPIFTSERSLYGASNAFNEVMGYPASQFATEYWFPWYDNSSMTTWILVGNPSTTSTATVNIYIGGKLVGGPYSISKGGRITPRFNITPSGPVRVVSTNGVKIFTSERVVYGDSFNEVMGYPNNQLTTEYFFPWYDNASMMTWVLVGNPTSTAASVDIYVGGVKSHTTTIPPGKQINQRFLLNTGPVRVVSTNGVKIFTSERVLYGPSFNEVMGYPGDNLTTEYWFPWYDNASMTTDIVVGRP